MRKAEHSRDDRCSIPSREQVSRSWGAQRFLASRRFRRLRTGRAQSFSAAISSGLLSLFFGLNRGRTARSPARENAEEMALEHRPIGRTFSAKVREVQINERLVQPPADRVYYPVLLSRGLWVR